MPLLMNLRAMNSTSRLRHTFMARNNCGEVRFSTSMPAKLATESKASRLCSARRSDGVMAFSLSCCM